MNKRILSLVLSFMLALGCAGVFAADDSEKMKEGLKRVSDAVVLYKESCKALVMGKACYTDEKDRMVTPKSIDGTLYVPVRFVVEAFGGTAGWNNKRSLATFECGNATISVNAERNKLEINGKAANGDVKAFYERIYLPVEMLAETIGKKVSYDDAMIIIGSSEECFEEDETELKNEVFKKLAWQRPSVETITEDYEKTNPNNSHPRVLCNQTQWEGLKKVAKREKILASMMENFPKGGDLVLEYDLPEYILTSSGKLLNVSREVLNIAERLAMQYRLTGDKRYAEKAWDVLERVCNFPDWNNNHWLDTAEMAAAVSIMFDWCYDAFTKEQRSFVVETLKNYCLLPAAEVYSFPKGVRGNNNGGWVYAMSNWSAVCNGGVAMAAIAVMGEGDEETEQLAAECIAGGLKSVENMLVGFGYDGAWVEGPYLTYLMKYYAMYMSTLESGLGTDYGYFFSPGVPNSIYFLNYLDGAVQTFNYSDSGAAKSNNIAEAVYFAKRLNDKGTAGFCYEGMKAGAGSFRGIIWYPEGLLGEDCLVGMDKDRLFETTGVISTRNEWYDQNGISLLAKGGTPNVNHGHSDIGTFVIDCGGERFFSELGADSYNLEKYIGSDWYYRKRAEGHNTIVINPEEKDAQNSKFAPVKMQSKPRGSISVIDMQPVYDEYAESMKRGFWFTDNRQTIVIRDEIKLYSKGQVYWFAHTPADIELTDNSKGAVLTIGSQKMYAALLTDKAKFSVMDAEPLSTSPQKPLQTPNPDYKKLTVYLEDFLEGDITVVLMPINSDGKLPEKLPEIGNIDSWEIADGDIPTLQAIKINQRPIKNFNPYVHSYSVELSNDEMPKVSAKGATVTLPENLPGIAELKVGRGDNTSVYKIYFTVPAKPVDLNGGKYVKYKAAGINASEVPEPANGPYNVIDGKKGTRWSASGSQWIEFDIGSVKTVGLIGLGWYLGDGRNYRCRLEYSEDGQKYTVLSVFETSGTTDEIEYYEFKPFNARYIRLNCNGCQDSDWNSLDEFEVYSESK